MDMVRVGPAPPGSTPFYRDANGVGFDGQNARKVDFGHSFDHERGYRVFFKFADSEAANTWKPEDLIRWCDFEPKDDAQRELIRIAARQARQCIALNTEWQRLGRPAGGVPTAPAGST